MVSWLNRSLVQVAAAGALLAPVAGLAQLAGAIARHRLEAERAASALARLEIRDTPLAVERLGGGRSNAVYRLRFRSRTLVLKQALARGTLLGLAARWVGPQPFGAASGAARIAREARALAALHAAGVRVPRPVAVCAEAGLLLVEHVAGEPLSTLLERARLAGQPEVVATRLRGYAAALHATHAAGFVLTDGHPGNALVDRAGEVALVDLEFAEPASALGATFAARCAFDVAYAAQFLEADERAVFLAAARASVLELEHASARLAAFAPLFERERRRQRRDRTVSAIPLAAARGAA